MKPWVCPVCGAGCAPTLQRCDHGGKAQGEKHSAPAETLEQQIERIKHEQLPTQPHWPVVQKPWWDRRDWTITCATDEVC